LVEGGIASDHKERFRIGSRRETRSAKVKERGLASTFDLAMIESKSSKKGMLLAEFWISGVSAPYSTQKERPWKEAVEREIPRRRDSMVETGVDFEFHLTGADTDPWVPDLDNLCEPMFSVLVNRLGWFGGKRANIRWWRASKRHEGKTGCRVRLWSGAVPKLGWGPNRLVVNAVFKGPLPLNAQNERMLSWSRSLQPNQRPFASWRYCLLLWFGDPSLNLGEIATGSVKSTIDCLVPLLRGEFGVPDDRWVTALQVEKGVAGVPKTGVEVLLWRAHP